MMNADNVNSTGLISTNGSPVHDILMDPGELRLGVYSQIHDDVVVVSYITMAVLGFFLNLWAILVISNGKRSNSSRGLRFQLINLAIADMITALVLPAYLLHHALIFPFPENEVLAKLICFVGLGVFYVSPLWNVAISIEWFVAVYFPFSMINYRMFHKVIVGIVVWVIGFCSAIEGLLYSKIGYFKNDYQIKVAMAQCHYTEKDHLKNVLHSFLILRFFFPPVIIATMYIIIGAKLYHQIRIVKKMEENKTHKTTGTKHKALKMLAVSGIVTLLTWLPYELVCNKGYDHDKRYIIITAISAGFQLSNCFTSPIIYYIFNRSFRKDNRYMMIKLAYKLSLLSKEDYMSNSGSNGVGKTVSQERSVISYIYNFRIKTIKRESSTTVSSTDEHD